MDGTEISTDNLTRTVKLTQDEMTELDKLETQMEAGEYVTMEEAFELHGPTPDPHPPSQLKPMQ